MSSSAICVGIVCCLLSAFFGFSPMVMVGDYTVTTPSHGNKSVPGATLLPARSLK